MADDGALQGHDRQPLPQRRCHLWRYAEPGNLSRVMRHNRECIMGHHPASLSAKAGARRACSGARAARASIACFAQPSSAPSRTSLLQLAHWSQCELGKRNCLASVASLERALEVICGALRHLSAPKGGVKLSI
jgi:hypothetical protein